MAKKWYVIHTYSGYEAKVRDALQQRATQYSLEDKFGEILIPSETVVENRFARAGTMITNGADEFRSQLGKARGSIARARQAGVPPVPDPLGLPDDDTDPGVLAVVR